MAKKYRYRVRVIPQRPITAFPIDMLRYDGLYPASEADASRIESSVRYARYMFEGQPVETSFGWDIALTAIRPKGWLATRARWQSFGWDVLSIEQLEEVP